MIRLRAACKVHRHHITRRVDLALGRLDIYSMYSKMAAVSDRIAEKPVPRTPQIILEYCISAAPLLSDCQETLNTPFLCMIIIKKKTSSVIP